MTDTFSREEIIRNRDHEFALSPEEHVDRLAESYPLRRVQIQRDWKNLLSSASISYDVETDPDHVVVEDEETGLRARGWNEPAATAALLRAKYAAEHGFPYSNGPADEDDLQKFDSYTPPAWETQVLHQDEGEYTDSLALVRLDLVTKSLPVEWYGLSSDGEIIYIRYRGGSLKVKVGLPGEADLAFKKQVKRFPDSSLSTQEMLSHLPPWITYISPLRELPEDVRDEINESILNMLSSETDAMRDVDYDDLFVESDDE